MAASVVGDNPIQFRATGEREAEQGKIPIKSGYAEILGSVKVRHLTPKWVAVLGPLWVGGSTKSSSWSPRWHAEETIYKVFCLLK